MEFFCLNSFTTFAEACAATLVLYLKNWQIVDCQRQSQIGVKIPTFSSITFSLNDTKCGFFSESSNQFLDLQISKKKIIPKNYPELEI